MNNPRRLGSIQKRILVITTSCLLGMCIIISYVSYYIFQNYLRQRLVYASEVNLRLLSDSINANLTDIDQMVRFCQTNANIASYIANTPDPGSVLSVSTYNRISEEFNSNPSGSYMVRLAVITDAHFLQIVNVAYSSTADLAAETPKLPFFNTLLEDKGYNLSTGFIKDPFYKNGADVLPIIRSINYKPESGRGGYLLIEVAQELFIHAFERYSTAEDSHVYLTLGEHCYLYEGDRLTEISPSNEAVRELASSSTVSEARVDEIRSREGVTDIMVSVPLKMPGSYISQNISHMELNSQKRLLWSILGSTLIGILGMGLLLVFTLNRMINIPVSKIRAKMLRVEEGDFERDPSIEWSHEIGDIGRGVNDLCENVFLLMQTRLEDEKQKKDLEYKMLQSQINPHFLYNTLNSIKWMADIQGASGISEMTASLAKLLRSISKGTRLLIPIREELSLAQDYFTIQSYRYGGTITLEIQTEAESLLNCLILKFTLQPLLENAIFHGIEPKGAGRITIRVAAEGEQGIRIDVTDDGVGMSREKIRQILQSDAQESRDLFREIGVYNVHRRLQYEFGEDCGITIESAEHEYTTMSIHIPAAPSADTRSDHV